MEETTEECRSDEDTERQKGAGEKKPIFDLFLTPGKFQPKQRRTPKRKFTEEGIERPRPRTPSGQVLTTSIDQIKTVLALEVGKTNKFKLPRIEKTLTATKSIDTTKNRPVNYMIKDLSKCETVTNPFPICDTIEVQATMSIQDTDINPVNCGQDVSMQIGKAVDQLMPSVEDNPETMDVRTVVKMLQDLKVSLCDSISADIKQHISQIDSSRDKEVKEMRAQINTLQQKVITCESKDRIMIDTMHGLSNKIRELQQKMENYEVEKAKRMVIFTGLDLSPKRATARQQLNSFFAEVMGLNLCIEDFYHIGQGPNKEVVLILLSIQQKKSIFHNIDSIKNVVNANGKKYRFRDFLTAKQNEYRKKCQNIADVVQDSHPGTEVMTDKGKLFVGNQEYIPKIEAPDPTSVLQLSLVKLNQIMSVPVQQGPTEEVQGNIFTGYTVCTNKIEDIQDAYMKLRLNHAGARHIVCAFRIPGINTAESNDHCDDEDYGASLPILQAMSQDNISCRAVFVVRKCGMKLNNDRIPAYIRIASNYNEEEDGDLEEAEEAEGEEDMMNQSEAEEEVKPGDAERSKADEEP